MIAISLSHQAETEANGSLLYGRCNIKCLVAYAGDMSSEL